MALLLLPRSSRLYGADGLNGVVGVYDGDDGEYDGDVGLYCGDEGRDVPETVT